jgi:uncharacterized protein YwgA
MDLMEDKKINLGDLIFILFYKYGGKIKGSTKLQKLIDIIRLDTDLKVNIEYSPYKYGNFSQQVNDTVQVFLDNQWLIKEEFMYQKDKKINIFRLSSKGKKIAKVLYDNLLTGELKSLNILDKFINKNQERIIAYSYFWYPKTAIKSRIREEIFKRSPILSNLEGDLEQEYNSIINSGKSVKEVIQESWKC